MMFAQSAVVAAVRDVVRACGRAGLVCLYAVCECAMWDVRCVACCWCALFWVTRAMMLTWCCGGRACRVVCVSARVIVWCDGSGERGAGRHVREVRVGTAIV